MKTIFYILCLTIGNYVYQAITGHDWTVALERSMFQAIAVAGFSIFLSITK